LEEGHVYLNESSSIIYTTMHSRADVKRFAIFNELASSKKTGGQIMLLITQLNSPTMPHEDARPELIARATELLRITNERTQNLLEQWREMNP